MGVTVIEEVALTVITAKEASKISNTIVIIIPIFKRLILPIFIITHIPKANFHVIK